jgi:TonB family protein
MSNRKQSFVTAACVVALAANSLTGFAQDKTALPPQEPARVRAQTIEPTAGATLVAGAPALSTTITSDGSVIAYGQNVAATVQPGQGGNGTIGFIAAEAGFDSKLVKGVPFSAEQVSEFSQPLADGNRIIRRASVMIYRDSQGRTRREANPAPPQLAEFVETQNLPKTIIINDPVEGATYVLEPRERIARRSRVGFANTSMTVLDRRSETGGALTVAGVPAEAASAGNVPRQIKVAGGVLQGSALKRVQPSYPPVAKAARASGPVQVQITVNEKGEVIEAMAVSGHPLLREAALEAARQWQFKPTELGGAPVKVQGVLTFNFTLGDDTNKDAEESTLPSKIALPASSRVQLNQERLAKQVIEGVECLGTRIVQTIPAGQIGNERPLEIITERWYSPELQATVMTKQSDPRYGETVVRLASILRVEPDEYLFKVPAEFTIKDDIGFRVMEERVRRPEQQ